MAAPNYKHFLTIGSSQIEVHPLNFLQSTLVDELEKDQVFYRRKFSGTLLFNNLRGNFDLLNAVREVDPDMEILLTIQKSGADYFQGFFTPKMGNFDMDECTFEVTPLVDDDYANILSNINMQYNLLSFDSPVTTRAIQATKDVTYTRNRWLWNVIESIAGYLKPGVNVSSSFFNDATNPVTLAPNNLTLLTIAQKSDIIRPTSSHPATQALISWNELMEILWGMFQVKWVYDSSTDTINIEHISWFTSITGLDLRTQLLCKATNKYLYLKQEMPKYENFAFIEANNPSFIGYPIMYVSEGVNQDPKTNSKDISINVTTDLEFIINNPKSISDKGFVILCNYESGGDYYVKLNASAFRSDVRLNMDLSWGNLHNSFFRHNRVLPEGNLNGVFTHFWTAQKTKQQDCYAILCDEYDPADEITTELGESYFGGAKASIRQSELRPSGEMKFTLLYGTPDVTPTPITDQKWILLWEDGCGALHAQLSEPADDDLDIQIIYFIFNADGSPLCNNGAGVTWTIPSGSTTDDFTIPGSDCGPEDIPAGGCIWYSPDSPYHFEVTGRTDWIVDFIKDAVCDCDPEDIN